MRKYLIALTIIGLLLLAGCGEEVVDSTAKSPYIGGNKGLVAEFESLGIEENGVYTIYDDESFPIQVLIKNKGEENVESGDVTVELYGIYTGDFSGLSSDELSSNEKIEGISEFNPDGDEIVINFGSDVKYKQIIQGDFIPLELFASYTYRYKTKASVPRACFIEDLRETDVCRVDETKTVYSSAGPIQVQSVEEQPAGSGKVSLKFNIENVGSGDSTIPGEEFNTRYDQLRYKIVPAAEASKWDCSAAGRENTARFSDDKATIICKLINPLESGDKYTKEIVLEIEYDYRDVIQESLRIKNSE